METGIQVDKKRAGNITEHFAAKYLYALTIKTTTMKMITTTITMTTTTTTTTT